MNILIGADPELFITDADGAKSAYGVIPGNKKAPHVVKDGAVQVDGMALEFNIDPADSKEKFIYNINSVLATLRSMVPDKFEMSVIPTAIFNPEYLQQQPKEALELGCDPDYNAYTQRLNPTPKPSRSSRSAGGHIHIGWTMDENPLDTSHFLSCCQLVQQLDYYLGIPSLIFDRDGVRRRTYGQAGAFRPKHYGVEYRVLSNFWLKDERLMDFVYTMTKMAFDDLIEGRLEMTEIEGPHVAQTCINTNHNLSAYKFIKRYSNVYEKFMPLIDEYYKGLPKPKNMQAPVEDHWGAEAWQRAVEARIAAQREENALRGDGPVGREARRLDRAVEMLERGPFAIHDDDEEFAP